MGSGRRFRHRRSFVAGLVAALVVGVVAPELVDASLTETVAQTTATAVPDPRTGWLPVDWVRHPLNPVHTMTPYDGEDVSAGSLDRQFPTVMRVDDKIANPLDGHRWYMWVWRHGRAPRTPTNGGRMILLTANSLEGPWTDRGFVSPQRSPGWSPYGWTGGDVVWSPKYQRFFAIPKSGGGSFLMESVDGVSWNLAATNQPILQNGPEWYDAEEAGYGRLLRFPGPDGAERWMYVYRANDAPRPNVERRLAIAVADDIHGPWTKSPDNPLYHFFLPEQPPVDAFKIAIGIGIDITCYQGYYQMFWSSNAGTLHLARSKDLRTWEDFGGTTTPEGEHISVPVFNTHGPKNVNSSGGHLLFDDTVGAWTYVYLGTDYTQPTTYPGAPVLQNVHLARSLRGGDAPSPVAGADCPPDPPFRKATTLSLAGDDPARGETVSASASLAAHDGSPLAGRSVVFTVRGQDTVAQTDANGRADAVFSVPDHGRDEVVAVRFDGDPRYAPSAATTTVSWGAT